MAFSEYKINLVLGLLTMAGRQALAERRPELGIGHPVAPRLPARQTFGLARQVFERCLDRLKTAAETRGADVPIIALGLGQDRRPRLKQRHERARPEHGDARSDLDD